MLQGLNEVCALKEGDVERCNVAPFHQTFTRLLWFKTSCASQHAAPGSSVKSSEAAATCSHLVSCRAQAWSCLNYALPQPWPAVLPQIPCEVHSL